MTINMVTSNKHTDSVFSLIKTLQKSEKRNFKLYVTRNSDSEQLKTVLLFNVMDKMEVYNEVEILKKCPQIKRVQFSNLKARLYRQILASLRLIKEDDNVDIQLHEQMDYARVLYNKALYQQSLKILNTIKTVAQHYNQFSCLQEILFFEKKIITQHITSIAQEDAGQLIDASVIVEKRLSVINTLYNLSIQLYSWYLKNGHTRNEADEVVIRNLFEKGIVPGMSPEGFYEQMYYCQSYCWYAFIIQDFPNYCRYAQKWVALFDQESHMIEVETIYYIKGVYNLLGAYFYLFEYAKHDELLEQLDAFSQTPVANKNENVRVQTFIYLYIGKISKHLLKGTFEEALPYVPDVEEKLEEYKVYLDDHQVFLLYYKIASLYLGCLHYNQAIHYLNKIIHGKAGTRSDLQCYARLLHLIAHYELGHYELLEYLSKSVYRQMRRMEFLTATEGVILNFLKAAFRMNAGEIEAGLKALLQTLKQYSSNPLETRSLIYLNIISWLESKCSSTRVTPFIPVETPK